MPVPSLKALLAAGAAMLLAACGVEESRAPAPSPGDLPALGLMTSLPLYWPLGADIADIAQGTAPLPWQRAALEESHALVLLDTLSPLAGMGEGAAEIDPLEGLARLAIIQPRGLSPADNVALDDWVRGGGRLLLVLDPQLTGDYDLPLGDPRRPSDGALIPPVLARWGLAITFDEAQDGATRVAPLGRGYVPLKLAGEVVVSPEAAPGCMSAAQGAAARCTVGTGRVLVLADAAVFEAATPSEEARRRIASLLAFAFD